MTFQVLQGASFYFNGHDYDDAFLLNVVASSQLLERKEAALDKDNSLRWMSGACAKDVQKAPRWKAALDQMCAKHGIYGAYLWPNHTDNLTKKKVEEHNDQAILPAVWTYQFAAASWDGIKRVLFFFHEVMFPTDGFHWDGKNGRAHV